jgi:WD40 repeat protein
MDRDILLWRTFGQCENYGILSGHKGAVLDLHWSRDSRVLFSASADKMLASWDLETGTRIRRHTGHEEIVNCMDVSKRGEELLVSGSDDGYIGVSLNAQHVVSGQVLITLDLGSTTKGSHRLYRDRIPCYCRSPVRSRK